MSRYPKTKAEMKNFAGTWAEAELDLDDFPAETKFIVGKEDNLNPIRLQYNCVLCKGNTYLDTRDLPVIKQGAVIICSKCYLKNLSKVKEKP